MEIPKLLNDDDWRAIVRQELHDRGKTIGQFNSFCAFYGYSNAKHWLLGRTRSIMICKLVIVLEALTRLPRKESE